MYMQKVDDIVWDLLKSDIASISLSKVFFPDDVHQPLY